MRTAIIIPYNKEEKMTLECLQRIAETTKEDDTYLIVVNGYVNKPNPIEHPAINKLVTIKNNSYCETINTGLKEIPDDCDRVFFMGNDSFPLSDNWLSELEKLRIKYDTVILSPDYTQGGKEKICNEKEDVWFHDMIPSIHYYMTKEHFDEVGLMDERFVGACYYSDDDYCRRVNRIYGRERIARAKNVVFDHRCSVEGRALGITGQMGINMRIYEEKWKR